MSVSLEKLYQLQFFETDIYKRVDDIANQLHKHLCQEVIFNAISITNSPGNSSSHIQSVFLEYAETLGFSSEKKGLFKEYKTSGLRPDYYMKIENTGILIEVERGKTVMNNMDLLDLWKCHICNEANYLFLMVPKNLKHNANLKGYNTFDIVFNRLKPFFKPNNYTNVHGLFLFGY